MYGLKPVPFTGRSFSAACKARIHIAADMYGLKPVPFMLKPLRFMLKPVFMLKQVSEVAAMGFCDLDGGQDGGRNYDGDIS
jgi:hypothetical protein